MYSPAVFKETRLPVLQELIRARPLATLITFNGTSPVADHIPMEIDVAAGEHGTLRGHVARGNPLWTSHRPEVEALAIFQGPEVYISPGYYPTKAATGEVVPTWNYVAVHAYGPLRTIDDPAWLRRLVERLTDHHEALRRDATGAVAWQVSDAPEHYIDNRLKAIVGIEIPIARIDGKWKMSQNRPAEDRTGVIDGLRSAGHRAAADAVEQADKGRK